MRGPSDVETNMASKMVGVDGLCIFFGWVPRNRGLPFSHLTLRLWPPALAEDARDADVLARRGPGPWRSLGSGRAPIRVLILWPGLVSSVELPMETIVYVSMGAIEAKQLTARPIWGGSLAVRKGNKKFCWLLQREQSVCHDYIVKKLVTSVSLQHGPSPQCRSPEIHGSHLV